VTGDWRKLHNDELHNLYFSPSIITRIIKSKEEEMGVVSSSNEKKRNTYRILVGKPERKRPL
jgi:hypothetical protein